MATLLAIDITVDYPSKPRALDAVRFAVAEGESVAVLGESGSGKSTLVLAILGLLDTTGATITGSIRFQGTELLGLPERRWRGIRGKSMAFVPQSAVSALNPALRLGAQMEEAWRIHSADRKLWKSRTLSLFERVSLPVDDGFLRRFPAQISVGQAQRVLIAMALLHRPRLLISDEPTSAVDPATRDGIRTLLGQVNREFGIANLLITHDVATVSGLCSRAVVMKDGRKLREASMSDLPLRQADAYARAMSSLYSESTGQELLDLSESLRNTALKPKAERVAIE